MLQSSVCKTNPAAALIGDLSKRERFPPRATRRPPPSPRVRARSFALWCRFAIRCYPPGTEGPMPHWLVVFLIAYLIVSLFDPVD